VSGAAGGLDAELLEQEKRIRLLRLKKEELALHADIEQQQMQHQHRHHQLPRPQSRRAPAVLNSRPGELFSAFNDLSELDREPVECQTQASSEAAYRIPSFISARKQQEAGVSQTIDRSGRVTFKVKEAAIEALSLGDWIVGNANIMMQLVKDGKLVSCSADGQVDTSRLMDYLQYMARIGDMFDLGFEKSRVLRFDDDCRLRQARGGSWEATCGDISLVATYLMAPQKAAANSSGRQGRRNAAGVCFDFNKESGCHRDNCRFAHRCPRCGLGQSEASAHREAGDVGRPTQ
jgi:hypothetical protein